jgi:Ca2+-binding RTX toxin-like protein
MTRNVHLIGAHRLRLVAGAAGAVAAGLALASPAVAAPPASASVANDTLTVTGTSGADRIALRLQAGAPNTLQVDFGDDGSAEFSFDRATFSEIEVLARSGRDEIRMDQVNGAFADEAATIDAGSGDDTFNGGDAAELFIGGSGTDFVDGNNGDDIAHLGSGADIFRWDPGDDNDTIEGQSGTDTLDFNGNNATENMRLQPNGERALFVRDVATVRMDMDGVERLDLAAFGNPDAFTVDDMSGTDFRRADVDLSGAAGGGDLQADNLTVNGTRRADRIDVDTDGARVDVRGLRTEVRISGSETIDVLQVKTLEGDDDVDVDDGVGAVIGVLVDLGPDQVVDVIEADLTGSTTSVAPTIPEATTTTLATNTTLSPTTIPPATQAPPSTAAPTTQVPSPPPPVTTEPPETSTTTLPIPTTLAPTTTSGSPPS